MPRSQAAPPTDPGTPTARRDGWTLEGLILLLSLFWLFSANRLFFDKALAGHEGGWLFPAALGVLVVALHVFLLGLVVNRWTARPVLAVLIIGTALASYYMGAFRVYLDPSMMRNVMRTDVSEARELLGPALLLHLGVFAVLPLLVLWRVKLRHRPFGRALLIRGLWLLGSAAVAVAALLSIYQPFSSLMRNQRELRYLITPANYLWSIGSVAHSMVRGAAKPREAIGQDAQPGPGWTASPRPRLLVLVVGETARAANWGLNGYVRPTTPALALLPVINFRDVTACGTNTEVSVPCLFAPVGRRDYDESRIRGQESLLHVLARAGADVFWRDNQSGCKGVCEGLPNETISEAKAPTLCKDGRCLDEALLLDLDERLAKVQGTQVLVLHMLGNHGPSYFRRYPPAFGTFQPACEKDDLQQCTREQIVNAYDNALRYTDHVLAELIKRLQARSDRVDTGMIYVSDHGESLGENQLFLHGVPYAIAPKEQTQVPMVAWFSDGLRARAGLDLTCLKQRAEQPAAHDHLFHTVLGLLDVRTALYESAYDLTRGCRPAP